MLGFDVMPSFMTVFQVWYLLWATLVQWSRSAPFKIAEDCPGYTASNVQKSDSGITADLTLAGAACDVYGTDLIDLKFEASYQTGKRVHPNFSEACHA